MKMRIRYIIYFTAYLPFIFFSNYFIIVFCGVYKFSNKQFLIGSLTSIGISFLLIDFGIIFMKANLWLISKKCNTQSIDFLFICYCKLLNLFK